MLSLKNIIKNYEMGGTTVHALRDVSVDFRENEFVAILGQSGCGKTTMLNIIGGLDRYTDGDLIIDGVSTKKYRDRDWDTYRNHKIGFVFQSYNLIPHQTVLSNVELALTLSGVSKSERRRRAVEVLEKVGLKDQMKKKPNQMSGGQMQRVAIARALINDPDILLADEPTGALDSETSIQIMEILKEISKDKLIIMVTHNPELAEEYANRIIRLVDGKITDDTNPFSCEQELLAAPPKVKKTSMSFLTALSLSRNNLMTKKGRTILTSFAGSIGIIGIALILSLSNGVQEYIDDVQRDTLSSYPLTIEDTATDMSSLMSAATDIVEDMEGHKLDKVYTNDRMGNMLTMMTSGTTTNDLKSFKEFLDSSEEIKPYISNIEYRYGLNLQIFNKTEDDEIIQVNPSQVLDNIGMGSMNAMMNLGATTTTGSSTNDIFTELTDNEAMFNAKYEVIAGKKAAAYNEAVLIVNEHNEISDYALYVLGLKDDTELKEALRDMLANKKDSIELSESKDYEYDDILGLTFSVIPASDLYEKNDEGLWEDKSDDEEFMEDAYENGFELKIVGIIRVKEDAAVSINDTIGYTTALTEMISRETNDSEIVKEQLENEDYDVFTGLPFEGTEAADKALEEAKKEAEKKKEEAEKLKDQLEQMMGAGSLTPDAGAGMPDLSTLTPDQLAILESLPDDEKMAYLASLGAGNGAGGTDGMTGGFGGFTGDFDFSDFDFENISDAQMQYFMSLPEDERNKLLEAMAGGANKSDIVSDGSLYENKKTLGVINLDTPASISIYPIDFEAKEAVIDIIKDYNNSVDEEKEITYTDMVGMLMSSVTDIINAISYILIAFVAISLVVSSIMIGIITYISVLERTKEIGILRSIGASKKDISRVFNAETIIVGLVSGCIGILITVLLNIPINIIILAITDIEGLAALPPVAGIILIAISVLLTLIAGLFPSSVASNKDPVVALRTE